jgi:hypothetical protein
MTISLDEVGDDIVENTAGGGVEGSDQPERRRDDAGRRDTSIDDEEELQKVAIELEEADRIEVEQDPADKKGEAPDGGEKGDPGEGFGHFRKWLEKMKEDEKQDGKEES